MSERLPADVVRRLQKLPRNGPRPSSGASGRDGGRNRAAGRVEFDARSGTGSRGRNIVDLQSELYRGPARRGDPRKCRPVAGFRCPAPTGVPTRNQPAQILRARPARSSTLLTCAAHVSPPPSSGTVARRRPCRPRRSRRIRPTPRGASSSASAVAGGDARRRRATASGRSILLIRRRPGPGRRRSTTSAAANAPRGAAGVHRRHEPRSSAPATLGMAQRLPAKARRAAGLACIPGEERLVTRIKVHGAQ